ncbi:MAG: hypothetical protein OEL75_04645 [Kiritimatiellaceae bacterium]|nr:hypothetical protein [Kiritimatiellaceae bacterium]
MTVFSLKQCYTVAWRSFKKWWIPLCLISGFILIFELIPRILLNPEMVELKQKVFELFQLLFSLNNLESLERIDALMLEMNQQFIGYSIQLIKLMGVAFPFVALLTVILLTWANAAVKDQRNKNSLGRMLYIALVHVLLAGMKMIAFLFCVLPGVYIYVRLLFVSLILLEEREAGLIEALSRSWLMTRGNFWNLFGLTAINAVFQMAAAPTVIGLIPVTGFVNTARAAAYQMLKDSVSGKKM